MSMAFSNPCAHTHALQVALSRSTALVSCQREFRVDFFCPPLYPLLSLSPPVQKLAGRVTSTAVLSDSAPFLCRFRGDRNHKRGRSLLSGNGSIGLVNDAMLLYPFPEKHASVCSVWV